MQLAANHHCSNQNQSTTSVIKIKPVEPLLLFLCLMIVAVQILLGPADADADDGEPDHPPGWNHLLQRRKHSLVDHLQRGFRHTFHGRLGSQLQDRHHQGRQHGDNTGPQVRGGSPST